MSLPRMKVQVSLSLAEHRRVRAEAARAGLPISVWVRALVRARLGGRLTLGDPHDINLVDALTELRRISVALNQLARANCPASASHDIIGLAEEARQAIRSIWAFLYGAKHDLTHGAV